MSDNPYERDQPGEQDSDPTAMTPDTAAGPEPASVTDDPVRVEPTHAPHDADTPVVSDPRHGEPTHAPHDADAPVVSDPGHGEPTHAPHDAATPVVSDPRHGEPTHAPHDADTPVFSDPRHGEPTHAPHDAETPVFSDPGHGEPTQAPDDAGAPVVEGPVADPDHAPREPALDELHEPVEPLHDEPSAHEPGAIDAGPATAPLPAATDDGERVTDAREPDRTPGTHGATRPVPRSGLTEHRSAGYLTGDLVPPRPAEADAEPRAAEPAPAAGSWPTGGAVGAAAAGGAAAGTGRREHAEHTADTAERPRTERDVVLDGSTAHTRPPSRVGAHVWAVLLTLLLTPVAWYLIADAGARLTLAPRNPWETGNLNIAALLELGGGLLVLVTVLLVARWSSLGAIVTGSLVLIAGVPFVAVPTWTQELLEPVQAWLVDLGDFGANVAHHLLASGSTGRLVVVGVALILVGVVSHGARRQGRREVRPLSETV